MGCYELLLQFDDVSSCIGKNTITIQELTSNGNVVLEYTVKVVNIDLDNNCLFVGINDNISAYTPFKRVIKG